MGLMELMLMQATFIIGFSTPNCIQTIKSWGGMSYLEDGLDFLNVKRVHSIRSIKSSPLFFKGFGSIQ
jgi:hypothetical protein